MSAASEVQALLRFLVQDAKVSLATAISKAKALQQASLSSPSAIASSKLADVQLIFEDEKQAKAVHNAAKRVKKRAADPESVRSPAKKRKPSYMEGASMSPKEQEAALALPEAVSEEEILQQTVLFTNRAPLVLAFAVTLLNYTMPAQPISSRLSLAQAVVSANAESKAISLGIEKGRTAEEEGWGEGQPVIKIFGRDVKVMRRWGYDPQSSSEPGEASKADDGAGKDSETETALWGVDLEALKQSKNSPGLNELPIHTPQGARDYLFKSFMSPPSDETFKTKSGKKVMEARELNLGKLLGALELLYESWRTTLSVDELDKRSWSWYMHVRPEVADGRAGWGGKGEVKLSRILDLRRSES